MKDWFESNIEEGWTVKVLAILELLKRADNIYQMIQVAGEQGITLDDYVVYQEAQLIDMVYLQQDAYDEVDVAVPIKRQKETFIKLFDAVRVDYKFIDQADASIFFTRLTGLFKNLNYAGYETPEYIDLMARIDQFIDQTEKKHDLSG